MGKGLRLAGYIAKQFTTKPLFDRMRKETRSLDRKYDRQLNRIEQGIEVDRINTPSQFREAGRMFDLVIREWDRLN